MPWFPPLDTLGNLVFFISAPTPQDRETRAPTMRFRRLTPGYFRVLQVSTSKYRLSVPPLPPLLTAGLIPPTARLSRSLLPD